ncbi:FIGNL1-interacting regulator of recombination and mitosis isoform X2 [Ambystoma mexicanum]|uniref:FIGNL1-interacting regulator of recombination and mitosis isoform X2 n=1 Tax=Ambystoma mexicanum TaxID=8296 RepID=UPI0037E9118B
MSQQTLLEEMSEWTAETCRKELPSALPRLLSLYQHSDCWVEHMRVLKMLTEMFLPYISLSDLEQKFFSQVIPMAVKLFDDLLSELSSQASGLTSQNLELQKTLRNLLQTLVQGLEALTTCVHHVCNLDEAVALDTIQSLPASVLQVLRSTFTHCRDSDSVYSGRLHLVSDLLQSIFKVAVSLHKQLMELLDKICIDSSATEEEIGDLVSVLHAVLDLCAVISNMDHALHANTWKFIIKQSLKHQSLIESQLRHNDIVAGLSEDIQIAYHSCLQLAENMKLSGTQESTEHRLFQKTTKLCRFFANSLVHYTKEFLPFLSGSCCRLHQLYLQIHSKFDPSLYATSMCESHRDEIACVFLVALDPLIDQLLSFRPFVEQVLGESLELSPELLFPQCLLLIHIMDKLPSQPEDVQSLWCTGSCFPEEIQRLSIFKAIFHSFLQCSAELSLPVRLKGTMVIGQAPAEVTFYQFVCIHLCAYIASIHPSHFGYLECALLEAVLSSSMLTSMLAMDSWCFLARYGTAELCAHHALLLAQLVKSCRGECCQLYHLSVLLRRLLFLMASDHQAEFIRAFPAADVENLTVWQNVSLKAFKTDLRKQVANDVISVGITECKRWLNGGCTSENPEKLVSCQTYLHQTVSLLAPLLGIHAQSVESQLIIQAVSFQTSLLQLDPPDYVHFAVLYFLICLGKLFIPQDVQSSVLPKLSTLFAALLSNPSWLIHQHSLEAFTQFAEETSHEEIVPQSLNREEIKNRVVDFLNKTNPSAETFEARLERVKQENTILQKYIVQMESGHVEDLTAKPSVKRARHEYPHKNPYESEMETAEGALKALLLLLQNVPPPDWLSLRLQDLQTLLTSLKRAEKLKKVD